MIRLELPIFETNLAKKPHSRKNIPQHFLSFRADGTVILLGVTFVYRANALLMSAFTFVYSPSLYPSHTTWCGQKSTDTTDSLTTPCIPVSVRKDEKWWNERIAYSRGGKCVSAQRSAFPKCGKCLSVQRMVFWSLGNSFWDIYCSL